MRKTIVIAAFVAASLSAAIFAATPAKAGAQHAAGATPTAISSTTMPTDISASRRHYRYVGNRWRTVRPYPAYGYYGPRPYYYRPYRAYVPLPFGFGFGFSPYYW